MPQFGVLYIFERRRGPQTSRSPGKISPFPLLTGLWAYTCKTGFYHAPKTVICNEKYTKQHLCLYTNKRSTLQN